MRPIRVLIADDERDLVDLLASAINAAPDLEFVGAAYDGEEALRLIIDIKPDVVLLDMIMPKLDGIAVLEELAELEVGRPKVIALTAVGEPEMTQKILDLGASYYIIKPFRTELLLRRIRQVGQETSRLAPVTHADPLWEKKVVELLAAIGIPVHFKGYTYLRDAVLVVLENRAYLNGVTTRLYPYIAEKYGTSPTVVERALRVAIEHAWSNGDIEYLYSLFGATISSNRGKPTNSAFIARVADLIKFGNSTA